jgi:hypothetical protein
MLRLSKQPVEVTLVKRYRLLIIVHYAAHQAAQVYQISQVDISILMVKYRLDWE